METLEFMELLRGADIVHDEDDRRVSKEGWSRGVRTMVDDTQ